MHNLVEDDRGMTLPFFPSASTAATMAGPLYDKRPVATLRSGWASMMSSTFARALLVPLLTTSPPPP
ncbi:hypothetical protein [Sorangium sp. So ce590]|uniref:hypothetical protein n=1 Tax=unclassified Sorangium TaxID=2621164 RepID=UPI003F6473D5